MRDTMKDVQKAKTLFAATDLLGSLFLWGGLLFAAYGLFQGFTFEAIWSAAAAGSGLSLLMVTHIGRAVIHIAETNTQILSRLPQADLA